MLAPRVRSLADTFPTKLVEQHYMRREVEGVVNFPQPQFIRSQEITDRAYCRRVHVNTVAFCSVYASLVLEPSSSRPSRFTSIAQPAQHFSMLVIAGTHSG